MALFGGLNPKPKKPWEVIDGMTPPIRDPQAGAMVPMEMAAAPKKPGFFDKGGFGQNWAGNTVDAYLQLRGMDPVYDPPEARRMRLFEQQRQADMDDFIAKEQWKRANPTPVNNDTVADYNFISQTLGPDAAKDYLRNRSDPVVNIPLPGGDVYVGPRSGLGGVGAARQAPSQPPQAAVALLRSNPALKADFDAKYGQGAADRALGGPTPSASGGFPGFPR